MTSKQDWARREDLRLALAKALTESPLKEALEVCVSLDIDQPQLMAANADLLQQQALTGAAREGYFRFLRNLKALTLEPAPKPSEPTPWVRQYPKGDE